MMEREGGESGMGRVCPPGLLLFSARLCIKMNVKPGQMAQKCLSPGQLLFLHSVENVHGLVQYHYFKTFTDKSD